MIYRVEVRDAEGALLRRFQVRASSEERAEMAAGAQRDDRVRAMALRGVDGWLQEQSYPKKPKIRGLRDFYRTLERTLTAGAKPMSALQKALVVTTDPALRAATVEIMVALRDEGKGLTEAFATQPHCFSERDLAVIEVGESGGSLPEVFGRLARESEGNVALLGKLINMALEPVIVLVLACVAMYVLAGELIPTVEEMFKEFNAKIPPLSQFVMSAAKFVRGSPLIPLLAIGVPTYLVFRWRELYATKTVQDGIWGIKPLQTFVVKVEASRAFRNLALLMACRTTIQEAFRMTAKTVSHYKVRQGFDQIRSDIVGDSAKSPHEAFLRARALFGDEGERIAGYVELGTATGTIAETVEALARDYTEDVAEALERAEKLIQPVILIILGAVVLLVVAGLIFPYLDLAQAIIGKQPQGGTTP